MRILLIEDDEIKRNQINRFLLESLKKADIKIAKSLQSGLKAIINNDFDFILLDMTMPTFDIGLDEDGGRPRAYGGREILQQMARRQILIPVIVVTQFDRFGKGADSLTLSELDEQLKFIYKNNYLGCIFYNSAVDSWKKDLKRLIDTIKT